MTPKHTCEMCGEPTDYMIAGGEFRCAACRGKVRAQRKALIDRLFAILDTHKDSRLPVLKQRAAKVTCDKVKRLFVANIEETSRADSVTAQLLERAWKHPKHVKTALEATLKEARREILETAMEKQRGLRARTASTPVKTELNLMSRGMFSETDMNTLRKAIASMAICAPERIKMSRSGAHSEYLEGDLSKIVGRLTDIIREDSKRPDLSRLLARSTDDRSDVFINISTWLKPTETGAQATVWSYTIRRKTNDIYCLSVV